MAVNAGVKARVGNFPTARAIALVHLAMFEAVNSIEPRYIPYRGRLSVEPGASRDAGAASAAHAVLVRVFPEQTAELDKALQASLAAVPDGTFKTQGVQLGQQAGAAIVAERRDDGSDAANNYRPFTVAGRYVPTVLPIGSTVVGVRPFSLKTGNQLRPPAPYSLKSTQWAKDFNEVKKMGAKTGSGRTAEQTDIARFWELTGTATYNPVVRQLSAAKGLDVLDNARLYSLFSMATADAGIAIFDAKYAYNFWRPVTAIRNADLDGNNDTERDPTMDRSQPQLADKPVHGNQTLADGIDCEKKTFKSHGAEQWRTVGRDKAWCCDFSAVQSQSRFGYGPDIASSTSDHDGLRTRGLELKTFSERTWHYAESRASVDKKLNFFDMSRRTGQTSLYVEQLHFNDPRKTMLHCSSENQRRNRADSSGRGAN